VIFRGNLVIFVELDFRKFLDTCLILIVLFTFSLHFKLVQFTEALLVHRLIVSRIRNDGKLKIFSCMSNFSLKLKQKLKIL